jgi:hypothetical protein
MFERFGRKFGTGLAALAVAGGLVLAGVSACDGDGGLLVPSGETPPQVRIELTDLPSELLASAEVWISRVYLVGGGQGQVDLFFDAEDPHHVDLLELRDGVRLDLTGDVEVPEGDYGQLRMVVDSAVVTLAEGRTFTDGSTSRPLFVPSGAESGIKVNLRDRDGSDPGEDEEGVLNLEEGTTTVVLVDFDVDRNFVFQGSEQAGFHGVLFTPMLKEIQREVEPTEG